VPCDQQPEACAAIVARLRAGTSPDAVAAMYENAIQIGLEIGAMMGNAMLSAQQPNMTTAGRTASGAGPGRGPIRHTYGQGSPTGGRAPPIHTGCVECRAGTAQ
jgi:hypothetical protein